MKANESLLLKEQTEIESAPFFPNFDLPEIDRTKPKFNFTGERLFRDRPDVYKAVVRLLAEPGVTIRTICRELHVTDDTVRAVKARENISIAAEKKNVLASITHGLRLASERVIELMPNASARDSLIGVGILGEKMQLLGGDATQRIDVRVSPGENVYDELRRFNERALKIIEAEVVPQMGPETEKPAQKALPAESEHPPLQVEHSEPAALSEAAR